MSWNDDHYIKDDDGNFINEEEAEKAVENNDLNVLTSGSLWDKETGEEYWPDGTKK